MAGGFFHFIDKASSINLRNDNGSRPYNIWVTNLQYKFHTRTIPMSLGIEFMRNVKQYSRTDPNLFTRTNRNQRNGYALSFLIGDLSAQHNWLLGYQFAHIETLAVNASFAQDDWVRFGSATQTDSSDFEGHEIRFGYSLSKHLNILTRLYVVQALTTAQKGKRWRLDLNISF